MNGDDNRSDDGRSSHDNERLMSLLAELIASLHDQTIAITRLAQSNAMIAEALMDPDDQTGHIYLDGSNAR